MTDELILRFPNGAELLGEVARTLGQLLPDGRRRAITVGAPVTCSRETQANHRAQAEDQILRLFSATRPRSESHDSSRSIAQASDIALEAFAAAGAFEQFRVDRFNGFSTSLVAQEEYMTAHAPDMTAVHVARNPTRTFPDRRHFNVAHMPLAGVSALIEHQFGTLHYRPNEYVHSGAVVPIRAWGHPVHAVLYGTLEVIRVNAHDYARTFVLMVRSEDLLDAPSSRPQHWRHLRIWCMDCEPGGGAHDLVFGTDFTEHLANREGASRRDVEILLSLRAQLVRGRLGARLNFRYGNTPRTPRQGMRNADWFLRTAMKQCCDLPPRAFAHEIDRRLHQTSGT